MTEKLSEYEITSRDGPYINVECNTKIINTLVRKINELVDVVNTIQKEREAEWFEIREWIDILEGVRESVNVHKKQIDELQMKLEPEKCKPVDPYAEQRKWIGKLCKFRDCEECGWQYGILMDIIENKDYPYLMEDVEWAECQPVLEDEFKNVIYKRENNED